MPKADTQRATAGWLTARVVRRGMALVVVAAVAAGLGWWRLGRPPEVPFVAPNRGTAVEIGYGTGAVEPERWAKVASLIRDRIIDLCLCEGKTVAKGDVLARLDDRQVKAQLQELRAREEVDVVRPAVQVAHEHRVGTRLRRSGGRGSGRGEAGQEDHGDDRPSCHRVRHRRASWWIGFVVECRSGRGDRPDSARAVYSGLRPPFHGPGAAARPQLFEHTRS